MLVGRAAVPWQQDLQQDTGVSWNNRDCDLAETQPGRIQLPTTLRVHQDLVFKVAPQTMTGYCRCPLDSDSEHAHPRPSVSPHNRARSTNSKWPQTPAATQACCAEFPHTELDQTTQRLQGCISATYAPTYRDITLLSDFRKHKPTHEAPECAFKPTTTCLATLKHLPVQSSPTPSWTKPTKHRAHGTPVYVHAQADPGSTPHKQATQLPSNSHRPP